MEYRKGLLLLQHKPKLTQQPTGAHPQQQASSAGEEEEEKEREDYLVKEDREGRVERQEEGEQKETHILYTDVNTLGL